MYILILRVRKIRNVLCISGEMHEMSSYTYIKQYGADLGYTDIKHVFCNYFSIVEFYIFGNRNVFIKTPQVYYILFSDFPLLMTAGSLCEHTRASFQLR